MPTTCGWMRKTPSITLCSAGDSLFLGLPVVAPQAVAAARLRAAGGERERKRKAGRARASAVILP